MRTIDVIDGIVTDEGRLSVGIVEDDDGQVVVSVVWSFDDDTDLGEPYLATFTPERAHWLGTKLRLAARKAQS